jgi:hypothetical protein
MITDRKRKMDMRIPATFQMQTRGGFDAGDLFRILADNPTTKTINFLGKWLGTPDKWISRYLGTSTMLF